jgi:hypothetical protein
VGHNIYILCHQLAQHNKELAAMLKPSETNSDPKINQALSYYASHTAQIEVCIFCCSDSQDIYFLSAHFLDCALRQKSGANCVSDSGNVRVPNHRHQSQDLQHR